MRDSVVHSPYADAPQSIGFNATISAPHMHAHCMHYMMDSLKPGKRVSVSSLAVEMDLYQILDVGIGSGYLTALIAYIIRNYHTSMHEF